MKKVAIFDVDGTIFRSSLLIELTERLIEKGFFPSTAQREYQYEYRRWHDREGSYEEYIDAVIKTFVKHLQGVAYGDFVDAGEEVFEQQKNRTYRYTRDLIKKLKKKKYYLLAISQSSKAILDKFCAHMGFDKIDISPNTQNHA